MGKGSGKRGAGEGGLWPWGRGGREVGTGAGAVDGADRRAAAGGDLEKEVGGTPTPCLGREGEEVWWRGPGTGSEPSLPCCY
jgi:hypothetical protein